MEYKIMSALSDASVPVPKMYLFCEDKTVMGQEFYVMEYIKVQLSTFDFQLLYRQIWKEVVNNDNWQEHFPLLSQNSSV